MASFIIQQTTNVDSNNGGKGWKMEAITGFVFQLKCKTTIILGGWCWKTSVKLVLFLQREYIFSSSLKPDSLEEIEKIK